MINKIFTIIVIVATAAFNPIALGGPDMADNVTSKSTMYNQAEGKFLKQADDTYEKEAEQKEEYMEGQAFSEGERIDSTDSENTQYKEYSTAILVALNKITAKTKELKFKLGEEKYFSNVKITVHRCIKSLDPYKPDNKILISVLETNIEEDQKLLFQGWIFSSSPSLSVFEHPVYEVFAKECL